MTADKLVTALLALERVRQGKVTRKTKNSSPTMKVAARVITLEGHPNRGWVVLPRKDGSWKFLCRLSEADLQSIALEV